MKTEIDSNNTAGAVAPAAPCSTSSIPAEPAMIERTLRICPDCYDLKGEMCHEPECVFCRKTMEEVGFILDATLIRPVVDGERLSL